MPSPLMGLPWLWCVCPDSYECGWWTARRCPEFSFHVDDLSTDLYTSAVNAGFPADVAGLGIYDPVGDAWLQTAAESALAQAELASARAEDAETRAENAEVRAETAEVRAETAEAETARLRAELARLQARRNE